jgi:hypothetical protein
LRKNREEKAMAIAVLDNPVLFGMRLGSELDQLRQSAMAQAISQSLREALDLHTWRYGMIANLLAAYHRAQSPEEKEAYAKFIEELTKSATYPHEELAPVVPGVVVPVPYLQRQFSWGDSLSGATPQNASQPQEQQGGSTQSNPPQLQQQPVEQQGTQQSQGTLGGILQQQPNQQQLTTSAQPSQQQPEGYEHAEQAMQIPDWSRITQTATDQVLPLVLFWYPLVKNDPRWRQALSGFLQVSFEKMNERQRNRP